MKPLMTLMLASPVALAFGMMAHAETPQTITGSFAPEKIHVEVLPAVSNAVAPLSLEELRALLDAAIARDEAKKIDPHHGDKDTLKEGEKPERNRPHHPAFNPEKPVEIRDHHPNFNPEKLREIREHHESRAENMFENMDRDGNGELTFTEFSRGARPVLEIHNLMRPAPGDDGYDHREANQDMGDRIGAAFSVGDINKDGVISKKEFKRGKGYMLQALHLKPGEELRDAQVKYQMMMISRELMRDDGQADDRHSDDEKPRNRFRDGTPRQ